MKKIIILGVIAALALFIFGGINTMPRLDEKAKASWSQVENQYQRRETISDPEAFKKYEAAQGQLSSALSKLMMVSEQYPNLKADQQFLALQSQLEGTENRITVARKDYIEVVQEFNTAVRTFPTLIWAKIQGMKVRPSFAATTPGAEKAPDVEF
jgi:LemA protein